MDDTETTETTDTDHLENALAHLYAAREHIRVVALRSATRQRQRERMRRARHTHDTAPPLRSTAEALELAG